MSKPQPEPFSGLLTKGLEEEVYTGTLEGEVIGLSHEISKALAGFTTEPDARNVEFTTAPYRDYDLLLDRLMTKRCQLRRWLESRGYTLVPGSTLSLAQRGDFQISDENKLYYRQIREAYGTDVVTASTHINVGLPDGLEDRHYETLMRAWRVARCDAPIYLALTAASPFLGGEATGFHSTRWHVFPPTPKEVPFFAEHRPFTEWFDAQVEAGVMFNTRHLWLAARPNGPATPRDLNRLELRICERISEPQHIAAMVALLEARVWQVLADPELDPLSPAHGGSANAEERSRELVEICRENEAATARDSLEAKVIDWRDGKTIAMRDWVDRYRDEVSAHATAQGFGERLEAIDDILENGNSAQRWLAWHNEGMSVSAILERAAQEQLAADWEYDPACSQVAP